MNCDEISIHLEAHFDGAATWELKNQIEAHLSGCHACAAKLHQLKAMRKMLTNSVIPMPTDLLDKKVMDAFGSRRVSSPARRSNWRDLFFGSVLIPKPALTIPLAVLVLAFLAGFQIGTKSAIQIAIPEPAKQAASPPNPTTLDLAESSDSSQRVALDNGARGHRRQSIGRVAKARHGRRLAPATRRSPFESFATISSSTTTYSTVASINGFEPVRDTKARIVKGGNER